jgi:hypothetical protein
MPVTTITIDDLLPFCPGLQQDKADAMIADAMAMALLAAPCIDDEDFAHNDQLKAIVRGAIVRWHESAQGELTGRTALGFSQTLDTRTQPRRSMYWPSEIVQLRELCSKPAEDADKAYSYDTVPKHTNHDAACSLNFGATYCSCGADIAGRPIYGVVP